MKRFNLFILIIVSLFILAGCGYYTPEDEVITEKYIETKENYYKGKKSTTDIYMIQTNKRLYKVGDNNAYDSAEDIYHSYNVGDNLTFRTKDSYTIVENTRNSS